MSADYYPTRALATGSKLAPRGFWLHNPTNIERGAYHKRPDVDWRGRSAVQPDPRFMAFADHVYGLRAAARIFGNYQKKHGIRTIARAIERWAPGFENNVAVYTESVVKDLRAHQPDITGATVVDFTDGAFMPRFLHAVACVEIGSAWAERIPLAVYEDAFGLAWGTWKAG